MIDSIKDRYVRCIFGSSSSKYTFRTPLLNLKVNDLVVVAVKLNPSSPFGLAIAKVKEIDVVLSKEEEAKIKEGMVIRNVICKIVPEEVELSSKATK